MKILVLQLKRIGDLILTTPALFALRKNLPEARITLAVDAACRELLPAIDFVDETLVYNRAGNNGALWKKLIFQTFDVCLDFTGTDRSALLAVLSKSKKRVAFDWIQRSRTKPMFYNCFVRSSVREHHTVDHYLHMLRALEIKASSKENPITLHLPEWPEKKARQLLAECKIGSIEKAGVSVGASNENETAPFILVHPGAARPEKYWLPDRWAAVIRWCEKELQIPCVITGSSDGFEQRHISEIKAEMKKNPGGKNVGEVGEVGGVGGVCDLSGRIDLLTLAALTKMARLVLSVDSAPMHLAAAFFNSQIALFGKTNPFHWHPRHENARILLAGNPQLNPLLKTHHDAAEMRELSTQQVIDAIVAVSLSRKSQLNHASQEIR